MHLFFPKIWAPKSANEDSLQQQEQDKNDTQVHDRQVDGENSEGESFTSLQDGVKAIEALTSVWTRSHLIMAYLFIWIIYFVSSMQQNMTFGLTPYVTSSFQAHSLTAATSIASSLIAGIIQLPLAKVLDIWGRPQGFSIMLFLLTIGLVMMAGCNNVETYAAYVYFYMEPGLSLPEPRLKYFTEWGLWSLSTGKAYSITELTEFARYNGMLYSLSIFVADTSSLKNRGFMFAFTSSPYLATVFIGGPLATAFLNGPGWRWAFGVFSIVEPATAIPLLILFTYNHRKAKKAGLLPIQDSGRTLWQSAKYYFVEFDVVGLLLISAGLALFLLPFSLYSYQPDGWRSPMIICLIVFGGLLLIGFVLYERFLAPQTFMPYGLLTDRTVLGAYILAGVLFIEFYIWNSFFSSFIQVVNNLTITEASYVGNIYTIGSCFWSLVVGLAIRTTGRFKWIALYFGLPLTVLGVGLMVKFRAPDQNIGYIIMCQIFIALGGGALVITEQLGAMSATSHKYVAVVIAVEAMFSYVGGAIGDTVASAMWTGLFPGKLRELLPPETQADWQTIYDDLTEQLSYPMGSPTRDAIISAYGYSQKWMLVASTSLLLPAFVAVIVWRDIDVRNKKQVKGRVV